MNKRYNDLNTYLRSLYGCRVQKITVDAGLSCPNRDGTLSTGGCIYCNARGSGTGAFARGLSLAEQLRSEMWLGFGRVIGGWSAGTQISYKDGLKLLQQGLENLELAAPNPWRPVFLVLIAETHRNDGETQHALSKIVNSLHLPKLTVRQLWVLG